MKKLSILICSLERRKHFLDRLLGVLNPQLNDDVEVLIATDNGEATIGDKRNGLMQQATGTYTCFVDDDDLVSPDYVKKILKAAEPGSDVIGMEGIITFDGGKAKKFIHSLRYDKWFEKRGTYYRNPNHLNPIKRELALREPFMPINMGEDSDFSKRMFQHLHSETYIDKPIYFYEFIPNKVV